MKIRLHNVLIHTLCIRVFDVRSHVLIHVHVHVEIEHIHTDERTHIGTSHSTRMTTLLPVAALAAKLCKLSLEARLVRRDEGDEVPATTTRMMMMIHSHLQNSNSPTHSRSNTHHHLIKDLLTHY